MIFTFINLVYLTDSVFYVIFAYASLFFIGIFGIILNSRKGYLIIVMAIEIILLSVALLFLGYSLHLDDATGHTFVILILTLAATVSTISLVLLLLHFFRSENVTVVSQKNRRINKYKKS